MSFVLKYLRFFKVSVLESGSDLALKDFAFAPAPATRQQLDDHRLVYRAREGGFEVYYQMNPMAADQLLGRITSRVRYSFSLSLASPGFFNRYKPDLTGVTGPQLYLDNLTAAGSLQAVAKDTLSVGDFVAADDAMKLYPPVFVVSADLSGASPPTKFIVRNKFEPADVVLEVPISASDGLASVAIDLSDHPAGPYTLETDAADSQPRTIYADSELAGAPVLGLVDIYWKTPQNTVPAGGLAYAIRFQKR
jgi:hypothetical protein